MKKYFLSLKKKVIGIALTTWMMFPWGYLCVFEKDGLTYSLTKNLWVIISDGTSSDALPIIYVAEWISIEYTERMAAMGYPQLQ